MSEPAQEDPNGNPGRDIRRQRSKAVRTAWVLAVIVLIIFAAFVLSGVIGTTPAP